MKLAHTNRFVALKNELGRDNRNCVRPTRLKTTQALKIRRPLTRLVARWHVCPETRRLECAWSLEPVACDGQLWRPRASNGRDCLDLQQEIRIGQPAQHAKRARRWVVAKVLLKDRARLGHVVRIADKDRHLHNVL